MFLVGACKEWKEPGGSVREGETGTRENRDPAIIELGV